MPSEHLSDQRLEEVLRRQPRWEPPRHFARTVVARMRSAVPDAPAPRGMAVVFRAAGVGTLAASLAYAAGLLLWRATSALLRDAGGAASGYQMLLELATAALIENAAVTAWVTAIVTLSIAASVTGRAREWI